jgi:hypothetical protein
MAPTRQRAAARSVAICALLLAAPAHALEIAEGAADLELLIQPVLALDESEDSRSATIGIDPHLARSYIALSGQVAPKLSFFAQVGVDDLGLDGDWSQAFGLRDAWIEWERGKRFQLVAGLMQPPWAIHAMLRDGTRLGVSDHGALLPYPTGIAGRDVGVMARGRILGQRLEYRLAGLAGIEAGQGQAATDYDGDGSPDAAPLNPDDIPRVTARLAWSFFDHQGGAGLAGFHQQALVLEESAQGLLSTRKVLTVGAAIDHQQDALYVEQRDYTGSVEAATRVNYTAATVDLLADLPLRGGARSLNVLLAGTHTMFDSDHPAAGNGVLAIAGYRIGRLQPIGSYELFDAHASTSYDQVAARIGAAWYLQAHASKLQLELGASRQGGGNDLLFEGRLQAQLMF